MRYIIYVFLLYIFLPISYRIDLISILLFFVILNEDDRFAVLFAFFCGLLIDLYYPVWLGINALIFTVLSQSVIFLKKFIVKETITVIIVFSIFYLLRVLITGIIILPKINVLTIGLTLILFLPIYLLLNRVFFRVWMKT